MINEFSIIRGGLLDRFFDKMHIVKKGSPSVFSKILLLLGFTWLPLIALSAWDHILIGKVDIPLWQDIGTHTRYLIVLPLMFLAESRVDKRSKQVISQFIQSGLIGPEEMDSFHQAKVKADRMCESLWAEVVMLIIVVIGVAVKITQNEYTLTSWFHPYGDDRLSFAGIWVVFVSLPLFQFLILRWLWRWLIWFRLLFMISKIKFRLHPAHPDKAGGLGFLGEPPLTFGPITLAIGVLFAAMLANRMLYLDFKLLEHYTLVLIFICLVIFINIAPLMVFVYKISNTRRKGIFDYGAFINHHYRLFDNKLIQNSSQESSMRIEDASTGVDLNDLYHAVDNMSPVPFDWRTMLTSLLTSIIPIVPLLFIELPIMDLLKMLLQMLF
ncbi:hypothetical protein N6H18_15655 [Reichenbachiella agarivorans]|uniref:Uncharacterized protein n=1 Tax=Reichenbachiella agarivorans TaxID=2979464 RepID=A0ABY6CQZ2_9BACT|nr:hypothetical protein [Reichenbachiella agarivorans]UXP31783.1 hypothetical protein N6H18_15655 [Reichenbachiella agarivorans]